MEALIIGLSISLGTMIYVVYISTHENKKTSHE